MRVLVIIPTYNERENLPVLVRQVLAHEGFRVMVVDDQSPDGTGAGRRRARARSSPAASTCCTAPASAASAARTSTR